ncbi:MAG: DUF1638 domain-containing protein [Thermotaleaceae bacterium]
MNTVVIACQTLGEELKLAMAETNCEYRVIWIGSEYHVYPEMLRKRLQEEIDRLNNVENILFAYGCCGNGLLDLHATTANLIIPKTDDCISILLSKPGESFQRKKKTYFLTKGWLDSSRGLLNEYKHTLKCYGEMRTKKVFELMLKNYQYLMLIDTKAYDLEEYKGKALELVKVFNLELQTTKGSLWFIKKLLTGPYDHDFCMIPKGEKVQISHFGYNYTNSSPHVI